MKREAYRHPKMLDLAARLNIELSFAVGLVGSMHEFAADFATQGDIGKHSNGAIAKACDWRRDPDELVTALVGAKWLDECARHRLVVHDLRDHAPQWWKEKLKKDKREFVNATPITPKRQRKKPKDVTEEAEPQAEPTPEPEAQGGSAGDSVEARGGATNQTPSNPFKPNTPLPPEGGRVEFVPDHQGVSRRLVKLYRDTVTFRHNFSGGPEILELLQDGKPEADLEAAIGHVKIWYDEQRIDPQMRLSARRFFKECQWIHFVDGVPGGESQSASSRAEMTRRMIESRDQNG